MGKYICPNCKRSIQEDAGFWRRHIGRINDAVSCAVGVLRRENVSYGTIVEVMSYILPVGKDKIAEMVSSQVLDYTYLGINYRDTIVIVHYYE